MQIPSIPPPIITNPLPQEAVAKAVTVIQTAAPLLQKAVTQAPKSEKFNETRRDKKQGGDEEPDTGHKESRADKEDGAEGNRGQTVNISV